MKAKEPGRSSGTLTIAFGMVAVPVSVFTGTDDTGIKRQMFTADGHEVGLQNYDKETGEIIDRSDVIKRFMSDDGSLIELGDEEIAAAAGCENGRADVEAFVSMDRLCDYHQEGLLQVRPAALGNGKAKKISPAVEKAFTLLMRGMESKDVFALLRYTLRGKPRIGALTSDGFLRQLAFEDEIRESLPVPQADLSDAELGMAGQLIEALYVDDAPQIEDEASAAVRAYANTKAASGEGFTPTVPSQGEVIDLMAALEASVAQANGEKVS